MCPPWPPLIGVGFSVGARFIVPPPPSFPRKRESNPLSPWERAGERADSPSLSLGDGEGAGG